MNLGSLKYAPGSRRSRKRLGRGNASGTGGTAGRGHKGYHARTGSNNRYWSEGGQMPIYRRLPKRGFKNINREEYQVVNLDVIDRLQLPAVTPDTLFKRKIIKSLSQPVKILGRGDLSAAVSITAHAFSETAKAKIEAAGGKVEIL